MTDGPLIVQSDKTLLLEVDHVLADDCRKAIAPFAELERAPEHVHTYRLTPLGLWNARAAGHDAEQVVDTLLRYSRYAVLHALLIDVAETMARYGRLRPLSPDAWAWSSSPAIARCSRRCCVPVLRPLLGARIDGDTVAVHVERSCSPQAGAAQAGLAGEDLAGYVDGEHHEITLRQEDWARCARTSARPSTGSHGGSGVVVPPCGAGKTLVGLAAMAEAKATTLILTMNTVAARQWRSELLRRTTLSELEIGEYSGAKKEIRPITIATYQVMTTRRKGVGTHLELFGLPRLGIDRV